MKVELKAYPAYRKSENQWIGEIPKGWGAWRLRFVAPLQGGYAFPSSEFSFEGIPVVRMTNLKRGEIDLSEAACVPGGPARFALNPSDLLLGMSGSVGETGSLGNYAEVRESDVPSFLNQRVGRFLPSSKLDRSFLRYLLQSKLFSEPLIVDVTGTAQFNISSAQVGNIRVPLPDNDEQRQVAAFLDRETAKIDRLMEVRRKQVERLQEQRSAVIHHAVTQGLDPHAPMKPSGIEWLGDVPEGWAVKRIKYVSRCNRMTLGEQTEADFVLDYIDIGNVTSKGEVLEVQTFEFKDAPSRARRKLGKGSVIISTVRTYLKAIAFIEEPAENLIVSTGFAVLEPRAELRPRFLFHAVASEYFIQRVIAESKGVGYPAINASDLVNIAVAFPENVTEQDKILSHIEGETAKFDTLVAKYRRELELLAEYRASLISHAVTGKIDVRGLAEPSSLCSPL
jgi:type I restriction enzyme S subunit